MKMCLCMGIYGYVKCMCVRACGGAYMCVRGSMQVDICVQVHACSWAPSRGGKQDHTHTLGAIYPVENTWVDPSTSLILKHT